VTAPAFTTNGKQVLRDGQHFADATTPADAEHIVTALGGAKANQLERDIIATGLRASAIMHTDIAAAMSAPHQGGTRKIFLDAAGLMLKAAKELSHAG
jgi:hypothetical protein